MLLCDASARQGSGHVMRQITLGLHLRRAGFATVLSCHEIPEQLEARALEFGLGIKRRHFRQEDPRVSESCDDDTSILVFDGYEFDTRVMSRSRRDGRLVVVVDDNGDFADVDCDVIVNQNLHADQLMYANNRHSPELLLGTRWALIRPEVAALARTDLDRSRDGVFISVGGLDALGRAKSLRELAILRRDWEVESAGGFSGSAPMSPLAMATHMWNSKVGVLACGTTTWEAACLGLPIIGLVVADNQVSVADSITKAGLGESFDIRDEFEPSMIIDSLEKLYDDHALVASRSTSARSLVDGLGGERVARRLHDLLEGVSQKS